MALVLITASCTVQINPSAVKGTADTTNDNSDDNVEPTTPVIITATVSRHADQIAATSYLPLTFALEFDAAIDPVSLEASDFTNSGTATGVNWAVESIDSDSFVVTATDATSSGTIIPDLSLNSITTIDTFNQLDVTNSDGGVTFTEPQALERIQNAPTASGVILDTDDLGKYAVYLDGSGYLHHLNLETRAQTLISEYMGTPFGSNSNVSMSGDGSTVTFSSVYLNGSLVHQPSVYIWRLSTGTLQTIRSYSYTNTDYHAGLSYGSGDSCSSGYANVGFVEQTYFNNPKLSKNGRYLSYAKSVLRYEGRSTGNSDCQFGAVFQAVPYDKTIELEILDLEDNSVDTVASYNGQLANTQMPNGSMDYDFDQGEITKINLSRDGNKIIWTHEFIDTAVLGSTNSSNDTRNYTAYIRDRSSNPSASTQSIYNSSSSNYSNPSAQEQTTYEFTHYFDQEGQNLYMMLNYTYYYTDGMTPINTNTATIYRVNNTSYALTSLLSLQDVSFSYVRISDDNNIIYLGSPFDLTNLPSGSGIQALYKYDVAQDLMTKVQETTFPGVISGDEKFHIFPTNSLTLGISNPQNGIFRALMP